MEVKPDIRYLNDMKMVLYDKNWARTAPNFELYYMYRGVKRREELRYDITAIPPQMLGKEFVKTKGHKHLSKYGEIYIILKGEAIFFLQKQKKENQIIEDVYAIKAKKGDAIIIPPFYGHVTINPSKKELKMANWVSEKCRSDYNSFERMGGACYFYTKDGWIKNKNYGKVPKLHFEKPLKRIPKNLEFLSYGN